MTAPRPDLDGPLGLADLLTLFRKRIALFLGVAALVTLVAIGAALVLTPVYSAVAQIKIDPNQRKLLDPQAGSSPIPDQAVVDTEVAVMRSPAVALAVVDRLDLTRAAEFAPKARRIRTGASMASTEAIRLATAATLSRRLKIGREGPTYLIDITALSRDPAMAAGVANALVAEYQRISMRSGADAASSQAAWLDQRLQALGAEVQDADARLANYKAQAGIVTGGGGGTITDQQIAPLSSELASAKSEAAAARSNLAAARAMVSTGALQSVSGVLNSPTIVDLRKQRAEVLRSQAEINSRYGPKHPEAIKVQQQLETIDQQMRDEGGRIVAGLQSSAAAADARVASLESGVSGLKAQQAGNNRAAVQADSLQRDADAKRAIYAQLSQTAQQTDQRQHLTETEGKLIASAAPPITPAFPNLTLFAGLGLIAGVLCGSAATFVAEALDHGLRTADDVSQAVGAPLLACVPALKLSDLRAGGRQPSSVDRFAVERPSSSFAEAFRAIRNTLALAGPKASRVVLVTSALEGEGSTTVALSLARIVGAGGGRAVVVDCDLRRPVPTGKAGLVEVLRGSAPLQDALIADPVAGVDRLAARAAGDEAFGLLATAAMTALLTQLNGQHDLVLLDCPPAPTMADVRMLAASADAVLVVAQWARTPHQAVHAVVDQFRSDGSKVLGVILNRA